MKKLIILFLVATLAACEDGTIWFGYQEYRDNFLIALQSDALSLDHKFSKSKNQDTLKISQKYTPDILENLPKGIAMQWKISEKATLKVGGKPLTKKDKIPFIQKKNTQVFTQVLSVFSEEGKERKYPVKITVQKIKFPLFVAGFAAGKFQEKDIVPKIKNMQKGYTLKTFDKISAPAVAKISADKKSIVFLKIGKFRADFTLQHAKFKDIKITNADFEISQKLAAEVLTFQKIAKTNQTQITTDEIYKNIQGNKKGYRLKKIVFSDPSDATVTGNAPNFQINLKKKQGIYFATITLENPIKLDAVIQKAAFQYIEKITWDREYSEDATIEDAIETKKQDFVLVGRVGSSPNYTPVLFKMNKRGDLLEQRRYAIKGRATKIIQTQDGGYFIFILRSAGVPAIIKINKSGDLVWLVRLSTNMFCHQMIKKPDGYLLVGPEARELSHSGGTLPNENFGTGNFVILKIDENARTVSKKVVPKITPSETMRVQYTPDGNFIAFSKNASGKNIVMKLDSQARQLWEKKVAITPKRIEITSAMQKSDGSYVLIAENANFSMFRKDEKAALIRLDANGNKLSENIFKVGRSLTMNFAQDGDHFVLLIPDRFSTKKFILRKFNADTNLLWERNIKSTDGRFIQDMFVVKDGYLFAGTFKRKLWMMKLDKNGEL